MARILSIDFDYFLGCGAELREGCFPSPDGFAAGDWDGCYERHPEVSGVGVASEYWSMRGLLMCEGGFRFLCRESHAGMREVAEALPRGAHEVVSVDFHHDCYAGFSRYDCSNWLRCFLEDFPESRALWVGRGDSQTSSMLGELPCRATTDFGEVGGGFDVVFLCFSPEWTPPHLRREYEGLRRICEKRRGRGV